MSTHIIHLGDLHLGIKFHKRSLLEDQKKALSQIVTIATERCAHVVIAGDVFDTVNPSIEAQELWFWFLEELAEKNFAQSTKTVVIAGNHDSASRLALAKSFTEAYNIHIVDKMSLYEVVTLPQDIKLLCIPFLKPTILESRLGIQTDDYDSAYREVIKLVAQETEINEHTPLVAHQTFEGGMTGESEFKPFMSDAISLDAVKDFPVVMAGHLHAKQQLNNVYYSGSLLPYAFGDKYLPSITIWEFDGEDWVREEVPINLVHPLKEIKGDLAHCLSIPDTMDYIKVKLVDCLHFDEALAKLEDHFSYLCCVITDSTDEWVADLSKPIAAFGNLEEALDAFCEHLEVPPLNKRRKELIQEALDAYSKTEDL